VFIISPWQNFVGSEKWWNLDPLTGRKSTPMFTDAIQNWRYWLSRTPHAQLAPVAYITQTLLHVFTNCM